VRIVGDNLFKSGSASIDPTFHVLLSRIADCVNDVPGHLLVTGHTDDRPIRSLKFKSNWELSMERAKEVTRILAARITPPGRLKSEGRADLEPVADNDTDANRARNRRVEITLLTPNSSQ
jgi:type VI secretion system protein ImpK